MDSRLQSRVAALHSCAERASQRLLFEQQNLVRLESKMAQIETDKAQLVMAVGLIDRCIQIISANGIGKIESVVSGGLQMVFEDSTMGLVVNKKETARGSSYELLLRHGDFTGKPMESFGGGVANVIAFLLRLVMVKRFRLAKMLCLDESFNNVSNEGGNLARVSALLKTLAEKGYTILAVTHQPLLASAADNVYRVVPGEESPRLVRVDKPTLGEASGDQESSVPAEVD